ncbi:sensor histidine kinase [Streptomyces sp. NPDC020917]|uniref:sensor histidine kinase n=1 Tax=Streptomyces sp. NPDC020917 TaxID=3365102 RepID=UPI00379696DE
MRQRVVRVAVAAVLIALVLLALPLVVGIRYAYFADERGELERDALAAAVRVSPQFTAGDPVELPRPAEGTHVGVYDAALRLKAGSGPPTADVTARRAAADATVSEHTGGQIVVSVPVTSNEQVIGVVRVATDAQIVWNRVLLAWLALLGVVAFALGVAVLVARRQAALLSAPLEDLSAACVATASGDLSVRAAGSDIAEIDQVARTQNAMVAELARLLQQGRHFAANASHQLRTPLTGLQLGLETALATPGADLRAASEEALAQCAHLRHTIDEVLRLAKADQGLTDTVTRSASDVMDRVEARWHGAFADEERRLAVTLQPGTEDLPVPERTAAQILDVLLDNARIHGTGRVDVTVRETGGALAIDVADEGTVPMSSTALFERGATTGDGTGIGLSLARDLAEAAGGRLTLASSRPTVFTLLLPQPD